MIACNNMDVSKRLIPYIKEKLNNADERISNAWCCIDRYREPLRMADNALYEEINACIEQYANENGLSQEWIDNIDIEELFGKL